VCLFAAFFCEMMLKGKCCLFAKMGKSLLKIGECLLMDVIECFQKKRKPRKENLRKT